MLHLLLLTVQLPVVLWHFAPDDLQSLVLVQ
jgi:hypothetical protein